MVEHFSDHRVIYGRWDRIFGCWIAPSNRKPAAEITPFRPLLDRHGNSILESKGTTASVDGLCWEVERQLHDEKFLEPNLWNTDWPDFAIRDLPNPDAMHSVAAYLNCIPRRIRLLAAPFGDWQWSVLDAMWRESKFAHFLASELRSFGPNFIIACLTLAVAHRLPKSDRYSLLQSTMYENRSKLLTRISDTRWPRVAVKVLKKMDCREACQDDFLDMLRCLKSSAKCKAIAHARCLNRRTIRHILELPDWSCLPNLVPFLDHPDLDMGFLHLLGNAQYGPLRDLKARIRRSLLGL